MLKLAALANAPGLGIAVPATGSLHAQPSRAKVEQRLLQQHVAVSTRSTVPDAYVVVGTGGLQTAGEPLHG